MRERFRRAHFARTQAQPQPQAIDEGRDTERDGVTLVRRDEGGEGRHQVRAHAGMDDALDAGKLWLAGNLGAEDKPGMTDRRGEEFRAEIARDDRPQPLIGAQRQPHPLDDPIAQQGVGVPHRMLEELLLGLEIVEDDALRRAGLQGNLFDRGPRHALGLEDFIGSLTELPAADLADFGELHDSS